MKKQWALPFMLLIALLLSGCGPIGEKSSSMILLYAATAILALLMLIGYCWLEKKYELWFFMLFSCVLVVNAGYFLLSISGNVTTALWANRLSYLGSVFLPLSMLMIVLGITRIRYFKWLPAALLCVSIVMFLLAASYPVLNWYYTDVTLHTELGATHLDKEYGPLHSLYLIYLMVYFAAIISVSIYAFAKKKIDSPLRVTILSAAVFINIGVWLVEQLVDVGFEMLSISYIITELFLLGLHLITKENDRLKAMIVQQAAAQAEASIPKTFTEGLAQLTQTEYTIFELYLAGKSTKETMEQLSITENTLKFHNKNLYGKLGVKNRKELVEIGRALTSENQP